MIILISAYFISIPLAFYDFKKSLNLTFFSPKKIKHGVIIRVRMNENITPKTIAFESWSHHWELGLPKFTSKSKKFILRPIAIGTKPKKGC